MIIYVPRENASDDAYRLVEADVDSGSEVRADDLLFVLESSKAAFDVFAEISGHFYAPELTVGAMYPVGAPLASIHPKSLEAARDEYDRAGSGGGEDTSAHEDGRMVSQAARALLDQHGLSPNDVPGSGPLRRSEVEAYVTARRPSVPSYSERIDVDAARAAQRDVFSRDDIASLKTSLNELQDIQREHLLRHVPIGTLLTERRRLADSLGFGEHSTVYDEALVLGDVEVDDHVWIGPFSVLDGSGGALRIGAYCNIGTGVHIYTHDTIGRVLTGGKASVHTAPTTIGACTFIAPLSIVAPGTRIGAHCFVAAGSYVQGHVPDYSFVRGNPAEVAGKVVIEGERYWIEVHDRD